MYFIWCYRVDILTIWTWGSLLQIDFRYVFYLMLQSWYSDYMDLAFSRSTFGMYFIDVTELIILTIWTWGSLLQIDFRYVFYFILQSWYSDYMDLGQPKTPYLGISDDSMSGSQDDMPQLDPSVCISVCVIKLIFWFQNNISYLNVTQQILSVWTWGNLGPHS